MTYDPKVIEALAKLRHAADHSDDISHPLARAFKTLDNAGVFAALDEQTDYAAAEEILAEAAIRETERDAGLDPAEWGDLTRADLVSHQCRTTAALPYAACDCGRKDETSPALHAGTCPVWARHHNLPTGIPGAGKGLTQRQARALFGDTEPLDEPLHGAAADKVRDDLRALGPLERIPGTNRLRPRRSDS